eukprot:9081238-Pyramimonas_sp.AAC.1
MSHVRYTVLDTSASARLSVSASLPRMSTSLTSASCPRAAFFASSPTLLPPASPPRPLLLAGPGDGSLSHAGRSSTSSIATTSDLSSGRPRRG